MINVYIFMNSWSHRGRAALVVWLLNPDRRRDDCSKRCTRVCSSPVGRCFQIDDFISTISRHNRRAVGICCTTVSSSPTPIYQTFTADDFEEILLETFIHETIDDWVDTAVAVTENLRKCICDPIGRIAVGFFSATEKDE